MRIIYLTNSRLPGEKAHAIQIMKTCAALSAEHQLLLVHPHRENRDFLANVTDLQEYYQLPRPVARKTLPSLDIFNLIARLPKSWQARGFQLANALQLGTYHLALLPLLLRESPSAWYTRDSLSAALLCLLRPRQKVYFEAHTFPTSEMGLRLQRWMLPRLAGLGVLTHPLAQEYIDIGANPARIHILPDAADVGRFNRISQAQARQQLNLPANQPIAMYVGQMYAWKGMENLLEAARHMPDIHLYLVGGTPEELPRVQAMASKEGFHNLHFAGYVPPAQVPSWLAAADVLILPNSAKTAISRNHTSPLKLFEYMAAHRPIVATDIPSLRDILTDGENARLVPPDNGAALAQAVQYLIATPERAHAQADRALQDVQAHTWEKRAERIIALLQST